MSTNGHFLNGWRTDPMYTFSEAASLAGVSTGTVRNWLLGYTTGERQALPLFPQSDQGPMVSFLQLIEIMVAGRLRKVEHASYRKVYVAYQNAKSKYPYKYPFAHIDLEAIGGHIIHWVRGTTRQANIQALDDMQQWTLPGLFSEIRKDELDYESELASRWHPLSKSVPIVVDPQFSSGVPTISGRGITIDTIHKRFKDGRFSIDFIARDYELKRDLVEQAIRFAEQVAV